MRNSPTVRTGKHDANFATPDGRYAYFTCADEIMKCDEAAFSGDAILLSGNGNFIARYYSGDFNAYQRTYVLIPKDSRYFGLVYFSVKRVSESLAKRSAGSIVKFITKGDVEGISVPRYNEKAAIINQCLKEALIGSRQISHLTRLRDFLLPMLMNGQVEIKE